MHNIVLQTFVTLQSLPGSAGESKRGCIHLEEKVVYENEKLEPVSERT